MDLHFEGAAMLRAYLQETSDGAARIGAMTCDECLGAIDAYLDHELSITDMLRVHRHLFSCERCYGVTGSKATLYSLLADDAARDQPPGSLRERIIQRVAAEERIGPSARSRRAV